MAIRAIRKGPGKRREGSEAGSAEPGRAAQRELQAWLSSSLDYIWKHPLDPAAASQVCAGSCLKAQQKEDSSSKTRLRRSQPEARLGKAVPTRRSTWLHSTKLVGTFRVHQENNVRLKKGGMEILGKQQEKWVRVTEIWSSWWYKVLKGIYWTKRYIKSYYNIIVTDENTSFTYTVIN